MTEDFESLPDLALRTLGGSVVYATDEFFANRENLIKPGPANFSPDDYDDKGKVYDGWETRRRRDVGADFAIIRLAVPGLIRGVVIDTSWFKGNYPAHASVEAVNCGGYPSPKQLIAERWKSIVTKWPLEGDTVNHFLVSDERRFSHVRLTIYPDGGVARFRVHGDPVPDPTFLGGTIDLAALTNGGRVVECSNLFYSSPSNILMPGLSRNTSEGWENARRRDEGNDYVVVTLAGEGVIREVEIDTSYFIGNAPGWASLRATASAVPDDDAEWVDLVSHTRLQPDCRHRFLAETSRPFKHVRLDVYPDGGISRLRIHGELTPETLDRLRSRTEPA